MRLIVGLGNPGPDYERTRHNIGFRVLDCLAQRHASGERARGRFQGMTVECRIGNQKCLLLKPTTFMNRSGRAVGEALAFYKINAAIEMITVVDDMALPCGSIRLRAGGGDGGHNGLADISRALGSSNTPRLRVGIDNRPSYIDAADYVLGRFSDEQEVLIKPAIERAADAVECFVADGIEQAMNRFNKASDDGPPPSSTGPSAQAKSKDTDSTHPGWTGRDT